MSKQTIEAVVAGMVISAAMAGGFVLGWQLYSALRVLL